MAEDDDEVFSFGDFTFAPPPPPQPLTPPQPQPQPQPHINGLTSTAINDDLWGDFFVSPLPPKSSPSQFQFNSNNGISPPPVNPSSSGQPASGLPPIRADPGPNKSQKINGALPLSLFGEVDDNGNSNGWLDPNPNDNDVRNKSGNGSGMNFDGSGPELIVDDDKNENNDGDEDDEWEFMGAISGSGVVEEGKSKEQGVPVVSGSKVEPFPIMNQEKQAGQDAFNPISHKPWFMPQSRGFFVASLVNGAKDQSSEMVVSLKSTTSATNGFKWDPFSGVGNFGNGSGIVGNAKEIVASSVNKDDDFDDFGDFIDASQEVMSKDQEQEDVHTNSAEAQLPNGEVQEKKSVTGHSRGALPLSLFSDGTEESSDCLDIKDEVAHIPALSPGNSFSGQNSVISIHDLISNLYSQAPPTSSVGSTGKPAVNGVISSPLDGYDDWEDGSWEFKGASTENGVREQFSTATPRSMGQKQFEILPELQDYTHFYQQLSDSLCFLLSCQLDELKEAQNSDAITGNGGKAEALYDEIQETFKLLDSVISKDEFLKKGLQRNSCLSEFHEVLQGPKLNVIESEFLLSRRLQLAVNDWKVAAELLRHAMSMLKLLFLGSADEQSLYASSWSNIINVCVQELRYGASIWKRASENNAQHQILSDPRGHRYVQALGEIYKVVEVIQLSSKVYKPWILLRVSGLSQYFGVLDECDALWSNSGLKEAVQSLSDNVDFGCCESAQALVSSIKNIHAIDVIAMHDCVFMQHKPICQLSLLPQEILADMKTVMWGEKAYFNNLANLWANLISRDPPQLPYLQIS